MERSEKDSYENPSVHRIVADVRAGIRRKVDLEFCGCHVCREALKILGGEKGKMENEKIGLDEYLSLVKKAMHEYDSAAKEQGLQDWAMWKVTVVSAVQEIAFDPNAVTYAITGEDIFLPAGLSAEESAGCFAENFFLCVRDEVPVRGEEAVAEFASKVVM